MRARAGRVIATALRDAEDIFRNLKLYFVVASVTCLLLVTDVTGRGADLIISARVARKHAKMHPGAQHGVCVVVINSVNMNIFWLCARQWCAWHPKPHGSHPKIEVPRHTLALPPVPRPDAPHDVGRSELSAHPPRPLDRTNRALPTSHQTWGSSGAERGGGVGFTSQNRNSAVDARVNQGLVRRGGGGVLKNSLERRRRPAPRVQPRLERALLELGVVRGVLGFPSRRLVAGAESPQVVLYTWTVSRGRRGGGRQFGRKSRFSSVL